MDIDRDLPTFVHEFQVRLHDTDAAGVLFFGHLFRHLHDAYESFMDAIGYPLRALIASPDPQVRLRLPVARAQADYLRPLRQGDLVRISLRVAEVRTRSFALEYALADRSGQICARALTVHVLVATDPGDSPGLPEGLRRALAARRGREAPDPEPGGAPATERDTPTPQPGDPAESRAPTVDP